MTVSDILKDTNHVSENKAYSLGITEKDELDKLRINNDAIEEARNLTIEVYDKQGNKITTSALDVIKAIAKAVGLKEVDQKAYYNKLQTSEIKLSLNGKEYILNNKRFGGGSELMAILQIAAGKNLTPDGRFGYNTAQAFSACLEQDVNNNAGATNTGATTPENIGEISINFLSQENFYDDFIALLGQQAADKYKDVYKLFDGNGLITSIKINNTTKIVTMEYCYSVANNSYNSIAIRIQDIQNPNMNIDKAKFVKGIVEAIDKNEARLNYAQLKKSIEDGVKNIPADKLGKAQYDYVKANGWINVDNLDFDGGLVNTTGMTVNGDKLVVKYGASTLTPAKLDISKISTNNTFDQAKFIAELQKQSLTKLAKDRVEGDMLKYTKRGKDNYKINSMNDLYNGELLKNRIANMKTRLERTNKKLEQNTKYGNLINTTIVDDLKKQKDIIEKRIIIEDKYQTYRTILAKNIQELQGNKTANERGNQKNMWKKGVNEFITNLTSGIYKNLEFANMYLSGYRELLGTINNL